MSDLRNIRENWPLIAALSAGAVAWGWNTAQIAFSQTSQEKTEQRVAKVEGDITEIKQSLARIDANQRNTSSEVSRIRASLEALVRELRQME